MNAEAECHRGVATPEGPRALSLPVRADNRCKVDGSD